jgi:membrane fusion protein, multidrug efflux system
MVQAQAARPELSAFAGEVRARHEPALAFRVAGKIARRLVEVGDRVEPGQALAELEPQDLSLQVDASRAQRDAARSELELAQSEFARQQSLRERGLASGSAFDTAQARLQAAQARAEAAGAQLEVSRNQAGYAVLRAPAAGVIAQRLAEAGQVVAAGQAVFTLAEEGDLEVAIALPEHAIATVAAGQHVRVQLWSQPDRLLPGRVREIAPAADPASRTYATRIALDPGAAAVELGQSARVYFQAQAGSSLQLPLAAVSSEDGRAYVLKLDTDGRHLRRTEVELGSFSETGVPVLAGISEQDWVVAGGLHLLRDGQAIQPVDRDNRPLQPVQAK